MWVVAEASAFLRGWDGPRHGLQSCLQLPAFPLPAFSITGFTWEAWCRSKEKRKVKYCGGKAEQVQRRSCDVPARRPYVSLPSRTEMVGNRRTTNLILLCTDFFILFFEKQVIALKLFRKLVAICSSIAFILIPPLFWRAPNNHSMWCLIDYLLAFWLVHASQFNKQ